MPTEVLLRRALEAARHLSDPEPPWEALLRSASALMGTDGAVLIVQRHGQVDMRQIGANPAAVRDYVQHFHTQDLLLTVGMTSPVGSPFDTQNCLSARQRERSSYYSDFMCRHRMRQLGTVVLSRTSEDDWVSLGFQREVADSGLAGRMASPSIGRYLRALNDAVRDREERLRQRRLAGEAWFDVLGEATALLSPQGTIVHMGDASRCALEKHRLLRMHGIWHPLESVRTLVRAALEEAAQGKQRLALRTPSGAGESVEWSFARLDPSLCLLNESLVLLRVRFPPVSTGAEVELLRATFRLTRAEAGVLHALVEGKVVKEYALERGLSVHTVRKQVGNLMEKTGCSRQLEIVQKAMRVLGA